MPQKQTLTLEDLQSVSTLADAPKGALRTAAKNAEWIKVPGGKALFQPGDHANSIYFVKSGVFGAFHRASDGELELLGYIRTGEPVGEMAFLGATPHASAVYALRDAEVIRMPRGAFNKLARKFPDLLQTLSQMIVLRMRSNNRTALNERSQPKVFVMLATSPTIATKYLAKQLAKQLESINKTVKIIGPKEQGQSAYWFDQQELNHDIILLYGPIADNEWFRLCMRYADRIWILGRADAKPSDPLLPPENSPARTMRLIDVILLHNQDERAVSNGKDWRNAAGASRVFHWRTANERDAARIARTAAGRSVGLVLSGGGARAYAHIGAVRALREANVPIDFCGGTSMGAIIAANVAMGWSDEKIEQSILKAFVDSNPVNDYVLPVVSLTKGARVKRRLTRHFGDISIENMVLPFFCVSANLTTGQPTIHRQGLLREALRASIALPGVLPPVIMNNEVHVDGAVLNNFPVDVMQDFHRGPVLGVDVSQVRGLDAEEFIDPPGFFRWVLNNGFRKAPPIASLLLRTATLSTSNLDVRRANADILILPEMEDMDLRDWKSFDKATEAGYVATVKALEAGLLDSLAR